MNEQTHRAEPYSKRFSGVITSEIELIDALHRHLGHAYTLADLGTTYDTVGVEKTLVNALCIIMDEISDAKAALNQWHALNQKAKDEPSADEAQS